MKTGLFFSQAIVQCIGLLLPSVQYGCACFLPWAEPRIASETI
jgi:hypothetical protein